MEKNGKPAGYNERRYRAETRLSDDEAELVAGAAARDRVTLEKFLRIAAVDLAKRRSRRGDGRLPARKKYICCECKSILRSDCGKKELVHNYGCSKRKRDVMVGAY